MTRAELKSMARRQISGNIGMLFLCGLVTGLVNALPALGSFILFPVVSFGLTLNYMAVVAGQKASLGRLFEGFNNFGKVWCMNFLRGLFVSLWSLLFVIPGIVKGIAYSFAPFILADNPNMTATEAITESKRMTMGRKGEIFVLYFSFFWWFILGTVTFGIAYIYIGPYMSATFVNYYNSVKAASAPADFYPPEYAPPMNYGSAPEYPSYPVSPESQDNTGYVPQAVEAITPDGVCSPEAADCDNEPECDNTPCEPDAEKLDN